MNRKEEKYNKKKQTKKQVQNIKQQAEQVI